MLTQAQLIQRRRGIGSSEIAAAASENPFCNAHELWLRKRGLTNQEETLQTWLGHQLEPIVAARYTLETGAEVVRDQETYELAGVELCPGNENEFGPGVLLATPDFRLADDPSVLVECKTVGGHVDHHWSPVEEDGAPPYVLLQAQHQMGVTGAKRCDVAVLLMGFETRFFIYQIPFDQKLFDALIVIARNFWSKLIANEPMPIDESDAARAVLREIYKFRRPELRDAPPDARQWFEARFAAEAERKAAEKKKDLASNKLIELMADAEGIWGDGYKATYLENKNGVRSLRVTEIGAKRRAA
jgi:putative phage-type endonuclease